MMLSLLLVSVAHGLVVRDALRTVHPSVWAALEGRKLPSEVPLAECALGLELWRSRLAEGLVAESSPYPPGIDPKSLVPLARLTRRHPRLLGGALRLLASMEDGEEAVVAARALQTVERALGGGVVDELSADAALLEGEWLRRKSSPGLDRLEELASRIESDLVELREVMESLGRRPSRQGDGGRAWGSRASSSLGDDVDGYTTRSQDVVRSLERRTLRRRTKLLKAKFASKTLTSLDVVTPDEDEEGLEALEASKRGPIVVCLDTSHSMTGARETLSKATALAAARCALRQRRAVKVMAFGDTHELAEVDLDVSDVDGLLKLGAFLEHSFGGGTDVASPLRRALAHVRQTREWRDADVVLVTDGELMDPPVDDATIDALEREKTRRGLQVCGLLAGRARPPSHPYKNAMPGTPFARLCDSPVHTFLADKDDLSLLLRRCRAQEEEEGDPLEAALSAADDRLGERQQSTKASMLDQAVAFVERGLIDRAVEARLVVLGAVAREHVLFYGPPGTAKSELCRRLGKLLGGSSFEIALTKFTTLDDVFGPLSLRALDDDEYRRCDTGTFAQHADTVFLDEIFRAKSVLPALLGLLNERKWWDGPEIKPARLVSAVAASNSLPEQDDDGALFDRFLLRCVVRPVADDKVPALLLLDDDDEAVDPPPFELSESKAELPNFAVEFLCKARVHLRDVLGERVSDRRLKKCGELLRRVAAACGRNQVSCLDLLVTRYSLWSKPATLAQVDAWLFANVVPAVDPAFIPLLADAASRPGEEGLDQVDGLVDCIAEAAVEMRRNVEDLEEASHPLVAPSDLERARLDLANIARDRYDQLEILLSKALDLRRAKVCGDTSFEIDLSVAAVDTKQISPPEKDVESPSFDLSWSKKQAKARLSAADFRQWTAARRNRSSQTT